MCFGIEATVMTTATFQAGSLSDRALLRASGADARHFLHNLLTADIAGLPPGKAAYAALLTPQGKILFDMFVFDAGECFLIDSARSQVNELLRRLTFYRLRAKVDISVADNVHVAVSPREPGDGQPFADPRVGDLGWRACVTVQAAPAQGYRAARLRLGLADAEDLGSAEFFPHEANLDQFGGVSFAKGCYVGQEVVSRMEHRGTARSRMLPITLSGPAPARGSNILSGDKTVGTVLSSDGNRALALLRLDRLAEVSDPLLTDGVAVTVHKPGWMRYDVPGAKSP
jgi:tRNA-modifying protein YgfZ